MDGSYDGSTLPTMCTHPVLACEAKQQHGHSPAFLECLHKRSYRSRQVFHEPINVFVVLTRRTESCSGQPSRTNPTAPRLLAGISPLTTKLTRYVVSSSHEQPAGRSATYKLAVRASSLKFCAVFSRPGPSNRELYTPPVPWDSVYSHKGTSGFSVAWRVVAIVTHRSFGSKCWRSNIPFHGMIEHSLRSRFGLFFAAKRTRCTCFTLTSKPVAGGRNKRLNSSP